jgi:hypothetical protein
MVVLFVTGRHFFKEHITPHPFVLAAVMCSTYAPTHANNISLVYRAVKLSPEPYFVSPNVRKGTWVNYNLTQEITLKNLFVLFICCNRTNNFDGNGNKTPLITYKSVAQVLHISTFVHIFGNKLCTKVGDYLYWYWTSIKIQGNIRNQVCFFKANGDERRQVKHMVMFGHHFSTQSSQFFRRLS